MGLREQIKAKQSKAKQSKYRPGWARVSKSKQSKYRPARALVGPCVCQSNQIGFKLTQHKHARNTRARAANPACMPRNTRRESHVRKRPTRSGACTHAEAYTHARGTAHARAPHQTQIHVCVCVCVCARVFSFQTRGIGIRLTTLTQEVSQNTAIRCLIPAANSRIVRIVRVPFALAIVRQFLAIAMALAIATSVVWIR